MTRLNPLAAACALSLLASPALAQDVSQSPNAEPAPASSTQEPAPGAVTPEPAATDAQAAADATQAALQGAKPRAMPRLAVGTPDSYFKPILAVAGGLHQEVIHQALNPNREARLTTAVLARFGAEGKLGEYVTFRSEFERNLRAHGSGVWEGTASFSVRDQWVRLARWNAAVDAGIILDPASVDFFSSHVGDLLMADRYTRDPLLYSGFNRGQGLQASYSWKGLRAGLSFTSANPLSTSASYQVGGSFGGGSRLWERPLANFRIGQPDDDLHFTVLSPSVMYAHRFVEAKLAAQVFETNYQTNSKTDPRLKGVNLRGGVRGRLPLEAGGLSMELSPFFNAARVENDVANSTAGFADQTLETRFNATTLSAGLDVNLLGRSGVGVQFARVADENPTFIPATGTTPAQEPITRSNLRYFNVGGTWWFTDEVAGAVRYARFWKRADNQSNESDSSIFATLRLVL